MGAEVCFTNHIHIARESSALGPLERVGCKDVTPELIDKIAADDKKRWVQIDTVLPEEAYRVIDGFFERRPDLYFRAFGIGFTIRKFDLSVLESMPHVTKIWIDADLSDDKDAANIEYLREMTNLRGLHLDLYDCRDYGFLNDVSPNLEELILNVDASRGTVKFDYEQLLRFRRLNRLWIRKAKKHLERIAELPALKSISLNAIKAEDFGFLEGVGLEKFELTWCGSSDLSGLAALETLKELSLQRITKLDNVDFVRYLTNLEVLKLRDLKHLKTLPNLDGLTKLREIELSNVPLDVNSLNERTRALIAS